MLGVIGTIIGLIMGYELLGEAGLIIGAAIGYLVILVIKLTNKVNQQQNRLREILQEVRNLSQQVNSEPPPAPQDAYINDTSTNLETAEPADTERVTELASKKSHKQQWEEPYYVMLSQSSQEEMVSTAQPSITSEINTKQAHETGPLITENKSAPESVICEAYRTQETSALGNLLDKINLVTRVGIVILFFGVAFLLTFIAENITIPIEVRLLGVVLGAAAIFFFGWKIRKQRASYAVLLQGAAIGIWYLSTYAAINLYEIVSPTFGFTIMFFISVLAAVLAVIQDAKPMAMFGILGGFVAPILASTGSGNHVILFSYYTILNLGILSIVWFKAWRQLTLMGFIFTFLIGAIWGVTQYQTEKFASTEPFLILFILFYIAVVMIFALRKKWKHDITLDGLIVYGTPVIGFSLQLALVEKFEYGAAWSALGFGLVYLLITGLWWKPLTEHSKLLRESFLAIAIIFLTLSIPFAFNYDTSAFLWLLEGVGGLWLAIKQKRFWGCALATLTQFGAGCLYAYDNPSMGDSFLLNPAYLSGILIAIAGVISALMLHVQNKVLNIRAWSGVMLAWGLLWWFGTFILQVIHHLDEAYYPATALLFLCFSAIIFQSVRNKFSWDPMRPILLAMFPAVIGIGVSSGLLVSHPSMYLGYIAWPLTILCCYWLFNYAKLYQKELSSSEKTTHKVLYLFTTILATWEVLWHVKEITQLNSWYLITIGIVPLLAAIIILKLRFWPEKLNLIYRNEIAAILLAYVLLNILLCNFIEPPSMMANYIPILNPLDIWQLTGFAAVVLWWRKQPHFMQQKIPENTGWYIIAASIFIYINTLLLRTLSSLLDIPFDLSSLLRSDVVQTCLSILWTVIGAGLFISSKQKNNRTLWFSAMTLIGVVVLKLFVIDLANSGSIERIVSFIVVGLLLLTVGYLIPIPEKERDG